MMKAVVGICALVAGCASPAERPVPGYLVDPVEHPHPRCAPPTFMAALGSSPRSRQDAISAARARMTGQLSAATESVITRSIVANKKGSRSTVEALFSQTSRETSSFDHAHLMKPI